jgi:hypothetical protein
LEYPSEEKYAISSHGGMEGTAIEVPSTSSLFYKSVNLFLEGRTLMI